LGFSPFLKIKKGIGFSQIIQKLNFNKTISAKANYTYFPFIPSGKKLEAIEQYIKKTGV